MSAQSFPTDIHTILLDGVIWNIFPLNQANKFVLDVRQEHEQTSQLVLLHTNENTTKPLNADLKWWEKIVGVDNDWIYIVEYKDPKDPSNQKLQKISFEGNRTEIDVFPEFNYPMIEPQLFEHLGEFHQTVSQFLGLELTLPCEYLESDNKIIISYYLRSQNGFDRFLLLIEDGQKQWKVHQDAEMKGFSPGAFFVWNNELIFIKDRNEVCIYGL